MYFNLDLIFYELQQERVSSISHCTAELERIMNYTLRVYINIVYLDDLEYRLHIAP